MSSTVLNVRDDENGQWVGTVSWGPGPDGRPRRKLVNGVTKHEVYTKLLTSL